MLIQPGWEYSVRSCFCWSSGSGSQPTLDEKESRCNLVCVCTLHHSQIHPRNHNHIVSYSLVSPFGLAKVEKGLWHPRVTAGSAPEGRQHVNGGRQIGYSAPITVVPYHFGALSPRQNYCIYLCQLPENRWWQVDGVGTLESKTPATATPPAL